MVKLFYDEICIFRTTDAAWCVIFDRSRGKNSPAVFLPKSKCVIDESEETITVPEWMAIDKRLI